VFPFAKTVWQLLPCAPGLLPVEAARLRLGLPRPSDTVSFVFAMFVSLAAICLLAFLVRRGGGLRLAAVAVALATFCTFAIRTLAAIRA
jgi:hypothetical protein